jgi:NADPH:quinone reductase-like Zn-dependent oxidoreductase
VLLSYADPATVPMMKRAMGWNFCPQALGERIMAEIVALVEKGVLRPVIGDVVDFDGLPAALERMRDRQTTGRTIIRLD